MNRANAILAAVMAGGIFLSSAVSGADPVQGPPEEQCPTMERVHHPFGRHNPAVPQGIDLLMRCVEVNVIADLTGLTQENVRQLLIGSPPPAILDAYNVPMDTYIAAMDKQVAKLVRQATASGIITKKQEEEIQKRMSIKPAAPRGQ
jgi:hypothetical protein